MLCNDESLMSGKIVRKCAHSAVHDSGRLFSLRVYFLYTRLPHRSLKNRKAMAAFTEAEVCSLSYQLMILQILLHIGHQMESQYQLYQ